jgi:hypothetical protein
LPVFKIARGLVGEYFFDGKYSEGKLIRAESAHNARRMLSLLILTLSMRDHKKARLLDAERLAGTHILATFLIINAFDRPSRAFFNKY